VRQRGPVAVDDAEEVHVPDPPQLVLLEALRLGVDGDDRVRDVGVDPAETLDRGLDAALDHREVGDVPGHGERLGAGALDFGDAVCKRLLVPRRDDDLSAALSGEARDRTAEAAGGPGDHEHLLVQRLLGHGPAIPVTRDATLRSCRRSASPGSS
jgi:hypothetical protein